MSAQRPAPSKFVLSPFSVLKHETKKKDQKLVAKDAKTNKVVKKLGKSKVKNMELEACLDETRAALAEEKKARAEERKRADRAEAWREIEKEELYGRKSRSCNSSDPTIYLRKQLNATKDAQGL